jgi:hypothetical protein
LGKKNKVEVGHLVNKIKHFEALARFLADFWYLCHSKIRLL